MTAWPLLTLAVRSEVDVVLARQRARQVAQFLRLEVLQQTRLATAVSEIVRNAFRYAGGGQVRYLVAPTPEPLSLVVEVSDRGPGIADLDARLEAVPRMGTRESAGIAVARRLVDGFQAESSGAGTRVTLRMRLPRAARPYTRDDLARLAAELARRPPESLLEELHQQHQELLRVLEDLTARQEQLQRLNHELEETNRGVMALYAQVTQELEDTNRGVLALYAELDDRAEALRRADRLKGQFISYLSHEFRTPLRSSVALSGFLLEGLSGRLGAEQETQVRLIRRGAHEALALVDDLLNLARIEAGKLETRPEAVSVEELFSALRGMLRPLATSDAVSLAFDDPAALPPLWTDPQKLAQILRNLISNALKFTERGEVRVGAEPGPEPGWIAFSVADTGIGIRPEDQERIFDDFTQVESAFERRPHGSGLGLPLSRKLAAMLGGTLSLASAPGEGSTFTLAIPASLAPPGEGEAAGADRPP